MKRTCVCAAWLGMALAGNAAANESGAYVSAGLGRSEVRNALGPSAFIVAEDKDDASLTLGVGYRFNRYLALDLGYVDLGEVEADLVTPGSTDFSVHDSSAVEGATLGFTGMLPIGRWEPYVKAGVLFSKTQWRFDGQIFGNSFSQRSSRDAEDPFYGAGLRYNLTGPLRIYLDATYFDEVGRTRGGTASYLNTSAGVLWQF